MASRPSVTQFHIEHPQPDRVGDWFEVTRKHQPILDGMVARRKLNARQQLGGTLVEAVPEELC
jgi:hypothetical protein